MARVGDCLCGNLCCTRSRKEVCNQKPPASGTTSHIYKLLLIIYTPSLHHKTLNMELHNLYLKRLYTLLSPLLSDSPGSVASSASLPSSARGLFNSPRASALLKAFRLLAIAQSAASLAPASTRNKG